jgi:hypothetical protein
MRRWPLRESFVEPFESGVILGVIALATAANASKATKTPAKPASG